ncbi:MAG: hypothetical protein ABR972_04460 [Acidimicrobiales bacterium]
MSGTAFRHRRRLEVVGHDGCVHSCRLGGLCRRDRLCRLGGLVRRRELVRRRGLVLHP